MKYRDPQHEHWAKQVEECFRRYPIQPFNAVPYSAVRGVTWRIVDGSGDHVAVVFEEEAARLICQRLNS